MSGPLDFILALSDRELEDVMAAVHLWCRERDIPLGSDEGQNALRIAAEARAAAASTRRSC